VTIPGWFTGQQTVTHPSRPSRNPAAHGRKSNAQPVHQKSDALTITEPSHLIKLIVTAGIYQLRELVIGFLCYGALEIVGVIIIIIITDQFPHCSSCVWRH